ncbi:MAG: hypothetical protein PHZ07_05210 [Patescibacteria group bacterium]|nr:hypothetical protein [Patescibacteria group bacterium]MDD4304801.1 hypothetical protein [Patescibacteria group bacterium]MDD4695853.1 hypothetical protein [Patescibacteria group bacterium]
MITRIIVGLLLCFLGFMVVWKTEWIVSNLGKNDWAESKLGSSGGTRIMYKFFGLFVIFFGMLFMTGLSSQFLMATVGKLLFIQK